MKYPNFREEKKLWRERYRRVVGLDEVGRGPLAGSVVAAAVCLRKNPKTDGELFSVSLTENSSLQIKDSKKLSPKKREEVYKILKDNPNVEWGIGRVSERVIDKINILEATKLTMKRAVKNLEKKLDKKSKNRSCQKSSDRTIFGRLDFLLIDGNFSINLDIPQKSIIKADEKVFSCAVASIIAKVTRDRMMLRYHKKYPCYCFDKHKGYPTKFHRKMLKKYGPCKIHRKSFRPIAKV